MDSGRASRHRPQYPQFRYGEPMKRSLGLFDGRKVYNERGIAMPLTNEVDLLNYLFEADAYGLTGSFNSVDLFPWLYKLVERPEVSALCDEYGKPTLLCVRHGNQRRWIGTSKMWGLPAELDSLKILRSSFKHCKVGVAISPSSLGARIALPMLHVRYTTPSIACEKFLDKHASGGVIYTLGIGLHFDQTVMVDITSAYPFHFDLEPDGTAQYFWHGTSLPIYFARCKVVIRRELPLGPFPVRVQGRGANYVEYPTEPGVYQAFLWHDQVDRSRAAGCDVTVQGGWGWDEYTSDTASIANKFWELRSSAPNDDTANIVKGASVSYIGSLARGRTIRKLLPESRADLVHDKPLILSGGEPVDLYIHEEYEERRPRMKHWNAYTVQRCNNTVYDFALPYAERGQLLMMYHDAVMVSDKGVMGLYPAKHSFEKISMGTWLWRLLHDVTLTARGRYTSLEEDRSGRPKKKGAA